MDEFRDSLLRLEPLLLPSLLRRSCHSGIDTAYGRAVIAILAVELPAQFGLPADIADFMQCVVGRIIEDPRPSTLASLYKVAQGCSPKCLEFLAQEILLDLGSRLRKALKESQSTAVYLHCLSIFAHIAQLPDGLYHGAEFLEMIQALREFFNEKKANKTLSLTVVGVIQVVAASLQTSSEEEYSIDQITLAGNIVVAVEPSQCAQWVQCNMAKLRKLYEKISKPEVPKAAKRATIGFLVNLVGTCSMPGSLWTDLLRDDIAHAHLVISLGTIQQIGSHLSPGFIEALLLKHLSKVLQPEQRPVCLFQNLVEGREFIKVLEVARDYCKVDDTLSAIFESPNAKSHLEELLGRYDQPWMIHASLRQLAELDRSPIVHEEVCPYVLLEECLQFHRKLYLLLAKALLGTSETTHRFQSQLNSLLSKLCEIGTIPPCCQEFVRCSESSCGQLSFFEVKATPSLQRSLDWRQQLVQELNHDAHRAYNSIVHSVTEVCKDLEVRCEGVEAPLRLERKRIEELQAQLKDFQNIRIENQNEIHDQDLVTRGLESEVSALSLKLNAELL